MHVQINRDKLKWPRLIQGRSQQVGGSAREDARHLWPQAVQLASKRTRVRSSNGKKSTRKSCSPGMVSTAAADSRNRHAQLRPGRA